MTSRSRLISHEQVTSERIQAFLQYWQSKRRDGDVPLRAGIDPLDIPRLLPFLVLSEIETEPFRVRYRLVGTRVAEANGADFTNRYLDQCGFSVQDLLMRCYQRLVETRAPVFAYYEWNKPDLERPQGRIGASQSSFFPLSTDGRLIDRAISIEDPEVAVFSSK